MIPPSLSDVLQDFLFEPSWIVPTPETIQLSFDFRRIMRQVKIPVYTNWEGYRVSPRPGHVAVELCKASNSLFPELNKVLEPRFLHLFTDGNQVPQGSQAVLSPFVIPRMYQSYFDDLKKDMMG